jgi:polyisoprenoid-binding protein YceI
MPSHFFKMIDLVRRSNRLLPVWTILFAFCIAPSPSLGQSISGTYVLSPANIDTGFSVRVLGRGPVTGQFTRVTGKMVLDQNRPNKSQVKVKVDLRTVQTDNAKVTGFLKSSAMFDVANHPVANFQSTRVRITGKNSAEIEGILSLRGQNKRTKLLVRVIGNNARGKVVFEVSGGFFRSLYGMDAGLPVYADKVNLKITGTGQRR